VTEFNLLYYSLLSNTPICLVLYYHWISSTLINIDWYLNVSLLQHISLLSKESDGYSIVAIIENLINNTHISLLLVNVHITSLINLTQWFLHSKPISILSKHIVAERVEICFIGLEGYKTNLEAMFEVSVMRAKVEVGLELPGSIVEV
jgi:hypothetical protein